MSESTENKNFKGWKVFIGLFLVIISLAMITGDSGPTKSTAYSMTENWVEDRLKSPSTADFPTRGYDEHTTQIDDNTFRIRSYVDSQNSFGAEIRTYFEAEVEFIGDRTWQLNYLDFIE